MSEKGSPSDEHIKKMILDSKLDEVRRIITGYDPKDLENLNLLIQDPEEFSTEISRLLPVSIKKMLQKGDISLESLQSVVEDVLKESIRKNPKNLSDILFPVMMPAIRKAVAEDIKRMLDTLNTVLENSFSAKKIGWRIKSLFSGKSYSEIVLSHAYIYQVKQVFLIHKETGLLLAHVEEGNQMNQKGDMVSSMLSAIKDFVQDSFQSEESNNLDTIELGKMNIWIEQGPKAIIAAIVEGNLPNAYRILLKETMEGIHVNFSRELEHFRGETTPFENNTSLLQRCLQKEMKEKKPRKPILSIVFFILIFALLGYWIYEKVNENHHFRQLVKAYEQIPGMVVTNTGKKDGTWYIRGLKDPLAQAPKNLELKYDLRPREVTLDFTGYLSLDPDIVLLRAKKILNPPPTVRLKYHYDTLFASGNATQSWIEKAQKTASQIAGIGTIIVKFPQEKPEKDILALEKHSFTFGFNGSQLDSIQTKEFKTMIAEAKSILNFGFQQDSVPVIVVLSHTSENGNKNSNIGIARRRAEQFINLMVHAGVPIEELVPKVVFVEEAHDNIPVRTVSFQVKYLKPEKK
jgi:OOP family OmpA-OmpF porin